jgi:superfamily II DNA or RNA helicase
MIEISFSGKKKDNLQLIGDNNAISLIREFFSVPNPAYRSNVPYVSSRLYCITPSGKFEIGLLKEVITFLTKNNIPYKIQEEIQKNFKPGFENFDLKKLKIPFRDYQEKAISYSLQQGRGVILLPTASGKTLVMAGLLLNLTNLLNKPTKTLVLVPSIQLVEQTYNDFIDYGLNDITKWSGGNKPDLNKNIIIAGTQILLSKNTDLSILNDIDLFLCDEAHGIRRGNNINKIFSLIQTPHRFGFTGTMPSSNIDQWNIIGKFGPINYEEKTISLKEQTYISNFQVFILKINHPHLPVFEYNIANTAIPYQQELEFLINSDHRNNIIANLAKKLQNNTLIMADRINHGELLETKLRQLCGVLRPIYFIRGSTELEEREEIRKLMDNKSDVIIVAISKIFSTGINIPNLHNVIFGSAGKAKIKIMQSIGRALRLHPTKKMATIFDIADNTKYGKIHLKERKKIYEHEKYKVSEKEI